MPNRDLPSEKELSIVVTVVGGKDCTRRCLAALESQVDFAKVEIIVPFDRWSADVRVLAQEFPQVHFHLIHDLGAAESERATAHQHRLYDRRRAIGLSLAHGRIVAITEDYAVPAEDWCDQILAMHKEPYAAIGGAIENAIDRPLNWALYYCDFGRYGRPFDSGATEYASDVNIAYKREALWSIRNVWRHAYHETTVHWGLLERGKVVYLDPRMVVYEMRPETTLARAMSERVQWGRVFAETRVEKLTSMQRFAISVGCVSLPLILSWRVLKNMLRQRRSFKHVARTLPLAFCLLLGWAWGEMTGYLAGRSADEVSLTATVPEA